MRAGGGAQKLVQIGAPTRRHSRGGEMTTTITTTDEIRRYYP
jgi:hypothetical protein